jgi:hypothetical protein
MRYKPLICTVAAALLASAGPFIMTYAATDKQKGEPGPRHHERGKALEGDVQTKAEQDISQQRKKLIDEAMSALEETKRALRALEEKKTDDALAALERATGKLNILLAREPALALAPIDVEVATFDLYGTVDAIKKAREQAEDYLEKGEVQKARDLIRVLASEIVLSVINLPLKTYPMAISAVTPLIDQGKIDEAKEAIQAALNTLLVVDHVTPLPILRADIRLARAEQIAQKQGRSEEDNKTLTKLLQEAREQLRLAEVLGYGSKKEYKQFYAEIDQIENKTKGGKSGNGIFDRLRSHLSDFKNSIFG